MKKWYFIVALLLVLGLSSCGSDDSNSQKEEVQKEVVVADTPLTEEQKNVVENWGWESVVENEITVKEFEIDSFTQIIDGKYFTSSTMAGGEKNAIDIMNFIIKNVRKDKAKAKK